MLKGADRRMEDVGLNVKNGEIRVFGHIMVLRLSFVLDEFEFIAKYQAMSITMVFCMFNL